MAEINLNYYFITDSLASCKKISLVKKYKSVNTQTGKSLQSHAEPYVLGLDFNPANQFCVLPVVECQAINRSDPQQKATIDACKKIKVEEIPIVQKSHQQNYC